jgi:hypothetical protein
MTEKITPPSFPIVSLTFKLQGNDYWLTTSVDLLIYHKTITTGQFCGLQIAEIKLLEWTAEEGEFKDCYVVYMPGSQSWRVGNDE